MPLVLGPLLGRIREDFQHFSRFMPDFEVCAECGSQQICMKVGARKSKQHADIVLGKNDGVGENSFIRIL